MQAMANSYGYNAMMSNGHHFSGAFSLIIKLLADVRRVMSAFYVLILDIIKNNKYTIREYC